VNKSKFLELVKNPDLIEEKDLTKLAELTSEHPYSQIIHVLNVKGLKIWNKPDFENALNLTAVYSYDRKVLHSIVAEVSTGEQATSQQTPAPADPGHPAEELEESMWVSDQRDANLCRRDGGGTGTASVPLASSVYRYC